MPGMAARPTPTLAGLAAAWLLAGAACAQPVAYTLDPTHSSVTFEVLHFDTSTLRGRFGPLEGIAELDRRARRGEVSLTIPTRIVSTGLPVLDSRLHQGDLFASEAYPEAYFVARHFVFDGDSLREVRGEFTLRGISRPLALRATSFSCGVHPLLERDWCGGDFEATLPRSAYGITHSLPFVADTVRLLVQVEAIRQTP